MQLLLELSVPFSVIQHPLIIIIMPAPKEDLSSTLAQLMTNVGGHVMSD
jgi:hypothetical protein